MTSALAGMLVTPRCQFRDSLPETKFGFVSHALDRSFNNRK